jgi:signal transduction histidine kinase
MMVATCGWLRAEPRRIGLQVAALTISSCLLAVPAHAAESGARLFGLIPLTSFAAALDRHEIAIGAFAAGLLLFALGAAILLLRTRRRLAETEANYRRQVIELAAKADRATTLLLSEQQLVIAWAVNADEPELVGDPAIASSDGALQPPLAFGAWLPPKDAQRIEHSIADLRAKGESFTLALTTLAGRHIEAEGRAIGGQAVVRLRDMSGVKRSLAEVEAQFQSLADDAGSLKTLIDSLPSPVWARNLDGDMDFVNAAYANAVEAADAAGAVERGLELLDRPAREESARMRESGAAFVSRVPAIVAGARRIFDVLEVPTARGSAGVAIDVTEVESLRTEMQRMIEAHRRTLDQLATGVAIFDADRNLTFYNAAYRLLWDLDAAFLDHTPSDSAILDRLRTARKLPEDQDFRQWKSQLHEAYRAIEAKEMLWHLPDQRTLRVVTTPNPEGGVTYLFDDVTERLDLERRFDALIRVQGETLDNLAEAVAVFASDGRLKLHNPAFSKMWKLAPETLAERPHIEAVLAWCAPLHPEDATLRALRSAITAIGPREPISGRLERRDGSVVDVSTMALPDGATLVTFQDVSDSVNVERALRERNEALVNADRIKADFLHHVSYELRSPLTNIIGFAQLLGDDTAGPLNIKQQEYTGYILDSSTALLAIINDILDLATVDAGIMELDLGEVDIPHTVEAATTGLRDRIAEARIDLRLDVPEDIGSFVADEKRIRQVLYNLLSNAIAFSDDGGVVSLVCRRTGDEITFVVEDQGRGIPDEYLQAVFERFESRTNGARRRGPGLGLSIVKSFVELHRGSVDIVSKMGVGTRVACRLPVNPSLAEAAE